MSFYPQSRSLSRRFRLVLASFLHRPDLPFADVLSEEAIEKAFDDEDASFAEDDDAVFTPAVTLWAFLSQVLFKDEQRSCVAAVARVAVLLTALSRGPCSSNTGAYCRARGKLSEKVIRQLAVSVGEGCEKEVSAEWLWHGRPVELVDGMTVTMPDTPRNQEAYPQNSQQKQGLGFPIARVVARLSLATAMVTGMAIGPYAGKETGELALLRSLLGQFKPGGVLLADRYYCSYFMIALLQQRGIDLVARLHQRRPVDFRSGRRLGKDDQIVTWSRPQRPAWMDEQTYDSMPASIEVRQIRVRVSQPGFRVDSFVVVTTLTDVEEYPKDEIADLYELRWQAELDIRAIKITMGMDILRCKTPEMVQKEMWTCLMAYNLIRRTMLQSAREAGVSPRTLSFTAAVQTVAASWLVTALGEDMLTSRVIDAALAVMAAQLVGNRPGRIEPRAVKRRPKEHALLTKPRAEARTDLMKGKSM